MMRCISAILLSAMPSLKMVSALSSSCHQTQQDGMAIKHNCRRGAHLYILSTFTRALLFNPGNVGGYSHSSKERSRMPSTPCVVRSLRMCGSMCYNTVVGSAPSYLSELLAAAQPFPLSPLFIGHMHACPKNKKLPPQNSWLSLFLTPQSSHLEQSPPGLQSGLSSQVSLTIMDNCCCRL